MASYKAILESSYYGADKEFEFEAPDNATNGGVIRAMFPKIEIYTDVINEIVDVEICEDSSELRCSVDWWNSPYKGVEND